MGLFDRITGMFSRKSSTLDIWREIYGGRESRSGAVVNWASAIEVATVLACVRSIANGVSQVPFRVYFDDGNGKRVATDHPVNSLIYRRPNDYQTAFGFRETMLMHVLLTGNAFAWVGRVGTAREVRRIELIEPGRVTVKRSRDGVLTYEVRDDAGGMMEFMQSEIWHLRGPSWNSWLGLDATRLARDAIGLSIATEQAHADFHRNGARASGLLSVQNTLSPERFNLLQSFLDKRMQGGDWAGKPLILDQGATFSQLQMTGVDAQHLETRKHQIEEICRAFGVMPIMVGHADKTATYASAEQMFLAHVVHTLSPWYERIEQSADLNLLTDQDREAGYYTKFTPNALMRGAAKDRAEYYAKALGAGGHPAWMTQNEIRMLEEQDRSDDPGADKLNPGANAVAADGAEPGQDQVQQNSVDLQAMMAGIQRGMVQ